MSHDRHCPSDWEARRRAEDDARYYRRDYYQRPFDCDEANDAYRREYLYQLDRQEEEERAERRRQERRQEEEYQAQLYAEEEQRRAEEEAYLAEQEEAHWEAMRDASVDTRPKDEDPAQTGASLASGAVPAQPGDAQPAEIPQQSQRTPS